MKRILLAAASSVAIACGGGSDPVHIQYGAPTAPTYTEQLAMTNAQTTLSGTTTYQSSTQPGVGSTGLADQLASDLGAFNGSLAAAPATGSPQLTALVAPSSPSATSLVTFDDPTCAVVGATSVNWNSCTVTQHIVDTTTGDTTDMTLVITGTFSWNTATGLTTWNVDEVVDMTITSSGNTMTMHATAALDGSVTVTASTIVGSTSSGIDATVYYMGMTVREAVDTAVSMNLGYATNPFCITSGTLQLEQIWRVRPTGATAADFPNQGWRFEWTGCGAFTVAHGS